MTDSDPLVYFIQKISMTVGGETQMGACHKLNIGERHPDEDTISLVIDMWGSKLPWIIQRSDGKNIWVKAGATNIIYLFCIGRMPVLEKHK